MVSSISRSIPTPAPRAAPPHYQSFLTPILHRRFAQSCLVCFCVCYVEAFLISSKSSCLFPHAEPPLTRANAGPFFVSFLVIVSTGLDGVQDFDSFLLRSTASSYPPCISAPCRHARQSVRVLHLEAERRVDWDIFYNPYLRVCFSGLHPTLLVVWEQERSVELHR